MVWKPTVVLGAAVALACSSSPVGPNIECTIPTDQIVAGGPVRDGIPALDLPDVDTAGAASYLFDLDRVLGVEIDGVARAYPLGLLWWHEVVNDTLNGRNIVVSYCPLTASGLVFDSFVQAQFRVFGVSGLLFENNLIMFDRQTNSLWNQLLMGSQCGPERGLELTRIPVVETTWEHWKTMHPENTVLTLDTGFERPYGAYPYGDYRLLNNEGTFFPTSPFGDERPAKELILGVREGAAAVAYPFGRLAELGNAVAVNDEVGGRPVLVTYRLRSASARGFDRRVNDQILTFTMTDEDSFTLTDDETGSTWDWRGVATGGALEGERLTPLTDAWTMFWFSWSVNYPTTRVFD